MEVLSKIEASIDFNEEDLPPDILKNLNQKIKNILNEIDGMLDDSTGEIIRDGYKIAIIGPPNSGKSSFLNMLVKRQAAIVSSVKGTTRDIIEVKYQINNYPVILTDTAGIRRTKNKIEKTGVALALSASKESNLDIVILDGTQSQIPNDIKSLIGNKSLVIINKKDKKNYNAKKLTKLLKFMKTKAIIEISIKDNDGIDKLQKTLIKIVSGIDTVQSTTLISRARHRVLLKKCSKCLNDYLNNDFKKNPEIAAADLQLASNNLGHIVGFIGVEEILGRIFKDFCIGK